MPHEKSKHLFGNLSTLQKEVKRLRAENRVVTREDKEYMKEAITLRNKINDLCRDESSLIFSKCQSLKSLANGLIP